MEFHIDSFNRFVREVPSIVTNRSVRADHDGIEHKLTIVGARVVPPKRNVTACMSTGDTYEGVVIVDYEHSKRSCAATSPKKGGNHGSAGKRKSRNGDEEEEEEDEEGGDDSDQEEKVEQKGGKKARRRAKKKGAADAEEADETESPRGKREVERGSVELTTLPCMVGSDLCKGAPLDGSGHFAGHFVVSGAEKVLVSQFLLQTDRWLAFTDRRCEIRSSVRGSRGARIATCILEIPAASDDPDGRGGAAKHGGVTMTLPFGAKTGPLTVPLATALASLQGDEEALRDIGEGDVERGGRLLASSVLPHCSNAAQKRACLMHGADHLRRVRLGERAPDDRDFAAYKRLDTAGDLCAQLLRMVIRSHLRAVRQQLRLALTNKAGAVACVDAADLLGGRRRPAALLTPAFRTGIFGTKRSRDVVQPLNRHNALAHLSHLSRISLTAAERASSTAMRSVAPSMYGLACLAETPEGRRIGLTLQIARTATVTPPIDDVEGVEKAAASICACAVETPKSPRKTCLVFVDGAPVGRFRGSPDDAALALRKLRAAGDIPRTCGVATDQGGAWVWCSGGRLMRPLVDPTCGTDRPQLVCAQQQTQMAGQLAETDPLALFGTAAATIPYSNHNQGPRLLFAASMVKQRISLPQPGPIATTPHHLTTWYGQRPIATTRATEEALYWAPCGINAVVAVLSYGYNQEDAVVISKGAVERGLFRVTYRRIYTAHLRDISGEEESFGRVPPESRRRRHAADYDLLDRDGTVPVGCTVGVGTVLVGVVARSVEQAGGGRQEEVAECRSLFCEAEGRVVKVELGARMARVHVERIFQPQVGDKVMSRHGQKGVVGMVANQEDLPFTGQGIVPDIVVNPHAFPSRMTVGQMLESAGAKLGALKGERYDASAFEQPVDLSDLRKYGFSESGEEDCIDGTTGNPMRITIGIVEYGALDKVRGPTRGPKKRTSITISPPHHTALFGFFGLLHCSTPDSSSTSAPAARSTRGGSPPRASASAADSAWAKWSVTTCWRGAPRRGFGMPLPWTPWKCTCAGGVGRHASRRARGSWPGPTATGPRASGRGRRACICPSPCWCSSTSSPSLPSRCAWSERTTYQHIGVKDRATAAAAHPATCMAEMEPCSSTTKGGRSRASTTSDATRVEPACRPWEPPCMWKAWARLGSDIFWAASGTSRISVRCLCTRAHEFPANTSNFLSTMAALILAGILGAQDRGVNGGHFGGGAADDPTKYNPAELFFEGDPIHDLTHLVPLILDCHSRLGKLSDGAIKGAWETYKKGWIFDRDHKKLTPLSKDQKKAGAGAAGFVHAAYVIYRQVCDWYLSGAAASPMVLGGAKSSDPEECDAVVAKAVKVVGKLPVADDTISLDWPLKMDQWERAMKRWCMTYGVRVVVFRGRGSPSKVSGGQLCGCGSECCGKDCHCREGRTCGGECSA